jgi:hypothetical protein
MHPGGTERGHELRIRSLSWEVIQPHIHVDPLSWFPSLVVFLVCFSLQKSLSSGLTLLSRTVFIVMQEMEPSEPRSAEVVRKPKATVPSVSKRPKKETKKKR